MALVSRIQFDVSVLLAHLVKMLKGPLGTALSGDISPDKTPSLISVNFSQG